MSSSIYLKLEASRKELLDLGLRNPLINYKRPKSKGLQIVDEKSDHIYDILVNQQKTMSFSGKPDKESGSPVLEFIEPTPDVLQQGYTDTKLQVNENETILQQKLLSIYYAARTSIEEQGINILYITLGMLEWFEADSSEEKRLAPLLLIPVIIDRSNARERFRVKYSGEEIGHNLSFQAKLKAEFGIVLPDIPLQDELKVVEYLSKVLEAIQSQRRWKVVDDHIELGFFSFGKFMIYHDLDNTKWPENARPVDNLMLQNLYEEGFKESPPTHGEDTFIDRETNAGELYQVVDADSSQLLALLAVQEGKNLVIQGPPGTGKSQTITNIIANAVGQGKKVLFVAEKMAALEVVKRRMDNIGLGETCLELHSQKANKKALHEELKKTLELGKPSIQKLKEEVILLAKHQEELNNYCEAVNSTIANSSYSPQQIFGFLLKLRNQTEQQTLPKIEIPDIENWNQEKQKNAESFAARVQERLKHVGNPSDLIFWGTDITVLLPHEEEGYKELLNLAAASVTKLNEQSNRMAKDLGLADPIDRKSAIYLATQAQLMSVKPDLNGMTITDQGWVSQRTDVEELLVSGKRLTQIRQEYEAILVPEAWKEDVLEIRQALKEHGTKWYKFLLGSYNKPVKRLKSLCKTELPSALDEKKKYVEAILESRRLEELLKEHQSLASRLFGARWQGMKSDWPLLGAAAEYLKNFHQQIIDGSCSKNLIQYLERQEAPAITREYHDTLLQLLAIHGKRIGEVLSKIQLDELRSKYKLTDQSFSDQFHCLSQWIERFSEIQMAISWNSLEELAKEEGLICLTKACINWNAAAQHLTAALQKTWYEYLIDLSIRDRPSLRKFERSTHEEVIQQFKTLDQLKLQYNRALVALKHWEGLPDITGDAAGQVRILKGEFNKRARHLPIRKLMQDAGLAIQSIKPVMMMSPLSIANFLSPGAIEFDLVVFDEASQVRPVEALGAMLRGKKVTVVGDTKQLPPTSFFDTLNDNIEDEENETADIQSILGMCEKQGLNPRMLRWHYRSRHESLITLSNYEFYENKLVIFPSPGSKAKMGLVYHYLPDTAYDRGQTRTNPLEAEKVGEAVMEHARLHPKMSLGVAAFSSAQRDAIQNVLERKRRERPELEEFFRTRGDEPFFVKNLENIQGDERDVIFISIGYGKTKEGYLSMSFGPLNNDGGERRLNVLITRAKQRCEVFTNITSADIDTTRSSKRGIVTLKSFLHYAQHGRLDIPEVSGKTFESPFEEIVAVQLEKLGYIVRSQIGSRGFYIDLAIVDPDHPGRYLLGIECDGASYHSARSARDRDRLRQQMLEAIGWRIHRIWGTDWFRNPDKELKRVVEAIEKAKIKAQMEDETEEEYIEEAVIEREEDAQETSKTPLYELAKLSSGLMDKELHLHSVGRLAQWVKEVALVESPVHIDEVKKRIAESAGVARVGSRISLHLQNAINLASRNNEITIKGQFLWLPTMTNPVLRNRAMLPNSSRKIKFISPEEMKIAIQQVVREAIAITAEAGVPVVARIFGFSRVTEDMKGEILDAFRDCVKDGILVLEGEFLKISNK